MSQERMALDNVAVSVMLLLTALWSFQQVTVKWIAADVSLVMQAAIRSIAHAGFEHTKRVARARAAFFRARRAALGAAMLGVLLAFIAGRSVRRRRCSSAPRALRMVMGEKGAVAITPTVIASLAESERRSMSFNAFVE